MIKYIKRKFIDNQKWNQLIAKSLNRMIYATTDYLDTSCDKQWDALIEFDDDDNYLFIMPLPFRKKFGFKYAYQPHFSQQLGVYSFKNITSDKTMAFLKAIPRSYRLVEISLNESQNLDNKYLSKDLFPLNNFVLSLNDEYEEIYKSISKNQRRNIKKASKFNLKLDKWLELEYVIHLFKDNKAKELGELINEFYLKLYQIVELMQQNNNIKIWGIRDEEGNLLSGAVFIRSFDRWIFLFSGTSLEGKQKGAMPLLLDNFIAYHCNTDMYLDFEGSKNKNLARFYKSYGSTKRTYLNYRRYLFPINLIKKIKK